MLKSTLYSIIIQGAGASLLILVEILLARLLGQKEYSIYATIAAWVYVLSLIATLGLNQLLLRFVPSYLAANDMQSLKGIIKRSNLWVLIACTAIFLIGIAATYFSKIDQTLFLPSVIALSTIPFLVLSSLRQSVLKGLAKFTYALMPDFIFKPLLFILFMTYFVFAVGQKLTANCALIFNMLAAVLVFAIGSYWQAKFLPSDIKKVKASYADKEWLLISISLLLATGLSVISYRIDILMLSMIKGVKDVGIYSAASRISDIVVFGVVSSNAVIVPTIAKLYNTNKLSELELLLNKSSKALLLFSLLIVMLLLVFGRQILSLFGEGFSDGYYVLVILVLGQSMSVLSGPVGAIMLMTGHQNSLVKIAFFSALLNLTLSILLIPKLEMLGAAISTSFSLLVINSLMLRFVRKNLFIEPNFLTNSYARNKI